MPRNKTVTTNDIKPGTTMYVSGKITFSRVSSLIQGKELENKIARETRAGRGKSCPDKPHTSIALTDARVMVKDPNHMTPAETYASETLIFSKIDPETGKTVWKLNFNNKSKYLPRVFVRNDSQKNVYDEIKLEKELDRGLNVTLCFSVYHSNQGHNNGVHIDTILINEPLRYYQNDVVSKLEQMGLTINRLPEDDNDTLGDMVAADDTTETAPMAAPVQSPTVNPFSAGAPTAPAYQAYASKTAPTAVESAPQAAAPAPAAPVEPNPLADPYDIGDLSNTPGGIVYNGNDDKY